MENRDGSLGIAVAQFASGPDRAANLEQIRILAARAVSRGASLVVFPEYSSYFQSPMGPEFVAAAEPLDGPFVAALAELAAGLGVHIVAGLAETTDDPGRFSNTVVAVSPQGEVLARYRKQHLYDAFGTRESDWVVPGALREVETFAFGGFTVGLQTCFDIRFPEVSRSLVDAGADLILVPAEWVPGPLKEEHWRTLLAVRAIENTVYIAAADHAAPSGAGNSAVIDPMGVSIASIGDGTDVVIGWISPARLAEVRRANPSLALRRYRVEPAG